MSLFFPYLVQWVYVLVMLACVFVMPGAGCDGLGDALRGPQDAQRGGGRRLCESLSFSVMYVHTAGHKTDGLLISYIYIYIYIYMYTHT
jgi:hypothetical protein